MRNEGETSGVWGMNALTDDRYHMAMAQDQLEVLYPPPPSTFTSHQNAVERLLPYHIYQIHESELEGQEGSASEAKRERRGEPFAL